MSAKPPASPAPAPPAPVAEMKFSAMELVMAIVALPAPPLAATMTTRRLPTGGENAAVVAVVEALLNTGAGVEMSWVTSPPYFRISHCANQVAPPSPLTPVGTTSPALAGEVV